MIKLKAKFAILSEVLSFPQIRDKDWHGDLGPSPGAVVGDLVAMSSVPSSKWYLSWLVDTKPDGAFSSMQYLLESIEDGSLCWWSNVGLSYYNRERISPQWRWTDQQFMFNRRWMNACKRENAYIVLPLQVCFHDDDSVTLGVRIRFGFSDFTNSKTFPNWKKLLMKSMQEYYLESVDKYDSENNSPQKSLNKEA